MKISISKSILFLVIAFVLASNAFAVIQTALSDQGTGVRDRISGTLLSSGNLTVEIWDSMTSGSMIYNETFTNAIINGSWNVMLGETFAKPLYLQFNKKYFKDYKINGEDVTFTNISGQSVQRQFFYSPMGELGSGTNASGQYSIAMGRNSYAPGNISVAIGDNNNALGYASVALGEGTSSSGEASITAGLDSAADGNYAIAMGYAPYAHGIASAALGDLTRAIGYASMAFGGNTDAIGYYSTALGLNAKATADESFAWGGDGCFDDGNTCNNTRQGVFAIYGGLCVATNTTVCPDIADGTAAVQELCINGDCRVAWPAGVTNGTNGINGLNGTNGVNGLNGTNGVNGTDGVNGTNGIDGSNNTGGWTNTTTATSTNLDVDVNFGMFFINSTSGKVGINTLIPLEMLEVNGTINAANYSAGGLVGITQNITIAKNATESCDLTITGGIITATTC